MNNKIFFSIALIFLSLISLLILFSIAPKKLASQAIFLLAGFLLYLYLSSQQPDLYYNVSWGAYFFVALVLIITLIFGRTIQGSTRWIEAFGLRLQISELSKPLLILFYANIMQKHPPKTLQNITLNLALAALPIGLIFLQPDLGTAIVHIIVWLTMVTIAGLPLWTIATTAVTSIVGIRFLPLILKPYQIERLNTFLHPQRDPLGSGYNVIQSRVAIGSGKIFGKGLGQGTQSHLRFLPEYHTDFIFAAFAEEFGLLGSMVLIGLYFYLLLNLLKILNSQNSSSAKLILTGVFTYLFFQTSLNIAMNLGLAPITGVTLPLISSGGSSILTTYITLGIALSTLKTLKPEPTLEVK